MIIPLPFIVSLLFTFTYATEFEYKIDLNRCGTDGDDMVCFVRKSCIETFATDDANKKIMDRFIVPSDGISDGVKNCDVIVQTKKFNDKKLMMLMQVKGSLKPENGIKIFQEVDPDAPDPNPTPVIACSKEKDPEGKITTLTLKSLGLSTYNSDMIFCSLTLNHDTRYSDDFITLDAKPDIIFTTTSTDEKLSWEKNNLWTTQQASCDPDFVGNAEPSEYIVTEIDKTRILFNCPNDGKLLLMYTKDNKDVTIETNEVKCENKKYKWTSPEPVTLPKETPFSIGCIKLKYCTACPEPPAFTQDECPTCQPLITEDANGCKIRKCPEGKFMINEKKEVTSPNGMTCERKDGQSKWLIHDTDDHNAVDGKASCYIFKGCEPFPKLKCPEGVVCKTGPVLNTDTFNYTCSDKDTILQQKKEPVTPTCDINTHEWNGVDTNVDLYCAVEEKKADASTGNNEPKGANVEVTIGVILGLLVIGGIVVFLLYKFVYKKRQDAKKTTKKEEGTSKKSSKKVESKSGGVGSSNEAKKEEKKSDPNKESEKPAVEAAKEAPKDGAEPPKETPKDAAATPAAAAATPTAPPTPGAAATSTPAAGANNKQEPPTPISNITSGPDSAPAPADATPV